MTRDPGSVRSCRPPRAGPDSDCSADSRRLFHHGDGEPAHQWVADDAIGGRRGEQADGVHAEIAPELEPDVALDIEAFPAIETGARRSHSARRFSRGVSRLSGSPITR